MDHAAHFARDSAVCGGETVIRGTRVTLRTVLASLAEGDAVDAERVDLLGFPYCQSGRAGVPAY